MRRVYTKPLLVVSTTASQHVTPLFATRLISTSSPRDATPLNHPAVPGPPPSPAQPAAPPAADPIARKKSQAELLKLGQSIRAGENATKATLLRKRFWKNVAVKPTNDGLQVHLDARPVRTPSKAVLTIPDTKLPLAAAIALEWDLLVSAQQATKHHYIPLTSLTARAHDIAAEDAASETKIRDSIVRMMLGYLSTDTLICWAPERSIYDAESKLESAGTPDRKDTLREVQVKTAMPIISHLTTHVWPGVEIKPVLEENSIMPTPQPEETTQVIKSWISGLPAFELAALERAVLASKSLLVATRLLVDWSEEFEDMRVKAGVKERFGIEEAAYACSLEVIWQTDVWGEVEDTHDVNKEDVRRQLGSAILLVQGAAR